MNSELRKDSDIMGKCKNCKFWELGYGLTKEEREEENIKEEPNYGHCRRYAPKPRSSKTDDWFSCDWPETQGSDWCGEFQPKETKSDDYIFNKSITVMDFSIRINNVLRREGIRTIQQLIDLGREKAYSLKNLGPASKREIIRKLGDLGITW